MPVIKQRFPRYQLEFPVLYRVEGPQLTKHGTGQMRNLSEGGACLELFEQLPPETPLVLIVRTDQGALEAEAKVVWVGEPSPHEQKVLHGISFIRRKPEQYQALLDLFPQEQRARWGMCRLPLNLSVTCRIMGASGPLLHGEAEDISRGGLLLRLPQALPLSTNLEITLPAPEEPLTLEGAIVWVEPLEATRPKELVRHGLRFTKAGFEQDLPLSLFIAECRRRLTEQGEA